MAPPHGATLLTAWHRHHRCDLAAHLETHGPLPLPVPRDYGWPARLAREIEAAGLTGRGGAAFPSVRKLVAAGTTGRGAVVVVNAMEGEPASDKDRVLLAVAPHLVLDGAALVATALGAGRVVVCVADDRHDTAAHVAQAIGERVGTHLGPPVELARPPAGYVSGEESALASWLAGGVGAPAFRPDRAVPLSISRRPALVHNAETLAHVGLIARYGAPWFRSLGSNGATGTTLVTVSGDVEHPGVHEVALGAPIEEIVARSTPNGAIRAVLVGGYGGSWIDTAALATPYAPAALRGLGAGVGAGILLVLGAGHCGLAEVARIARYMAGESAGQCGPCVFGLPAIAADLDELVRGSPHPGALEQRLHARLEAVDGRGACRHPDGVVRMVRSALAVFRDEVRHHLARGRCRCGDKAGPR
ncbi:MAG TPA: NADH-ubiquinone oxidoreductase-F iron-sulfur binding region domain-containing protein [Acidimicrobiales bacterium]|nr:NADH-ubiquinone oxidoreductase-F iron-sulfur binding region domain-containing protein [Acidimicrobiales bacterium]